MHLADGVLSAPVVVVTSAMAIGILAYSARGVRQEEVPKISLLAGAFFVSSLISIPVGPSSIHPMLGGLLGLMLGRRAPLAAFVGLLLQALLFQHGGITTLGANALIISIPALIVFFLSRTWKKGSLFWKGSLAGGMAVAGAVIILVGLLYFTDQRFGQGDVSVIHLLIILHLPLVVVEGLLTGSAVKFLANVRPGLLQTLIDPVGDGRVAKGAKR